MKLMNELVKEFFAQIRAYYAKKKAAQQRFIAKAIGPISCLDPNTAIEDYVSFESIDRGVACAQKQAPKVAKKNDIPAIDDRCRSEKLETILEAMVKDGSLEFHPKGRLKVS